MKRIIFLLFHFLKKTITHEHSHTDSISCVLLDEDLHHVGGFLAITQITDCIQTGLGRHLPTPPPKELFLNKIFLRLAEF